MPNWWLKLESGLTDAGKFWLRAMAVLTLLTGVYNANNIISVGLISLRRAGFAAVEQFQPFAEDGIKLLTGAKDEEIKKDKYLAPNQ